MIARRWTARATDEGARAYAAFFERVLVPQLDRIEGHLGALVMTRTLDDAGSDVQITVLTFWASMESILRFAGPALDRAVVEPEARALLLAFDERVSHEEVAVRSLRSPLR